MLGRKDLKNLLSWWKALHEEFKDIKVKEEVTEDTKVTESEDEDKFDELKEVDKQISELQVCCKFL